MQDHVHMLVSIPPTYALWRMVWCIKGTSANHWARGYFVSTVRRDEEVMRKYIREQEEAGTRRDQMNLWQYWATGSVAHIPKAPRAAALNGSHPKTSGFAGGYLLPVKLLGITLPSNYMDEPAFKSARTLELVTTVSLHPDGGLLLLENMTPDPEDLSIRRASFGRRGAEGWAFSSSHIWWQPPHRIRQEEVRHGTSACTVIVREDVSFQYVPQQNLLVTDSLLEPGPDWDSVSPPRGIFMLPSIRSVLRSSLLLSLPFRGRDWKVRDTGAGEMLGRPTRRVQAERQQTDDLHAHRDSDPPWRGVDEYRCDIDVDLEIGLQLTALRAGEPIAHVTADFLRVDGDFPQDLFIITPPFDTRIMRVVRWPEQEA